MDNKNFSFIVHCWFDSQTGATRLQVMNVDTTQEVHLGDATFLLRFTTDPPNSTERCLIRHIGSGREVYIQSGGGLRAFIQSCFKRL